MRIALFALALSLCICSTASASNVEVTYPDAKPRGIALVLHGGGWASGDGDEWLEAMRPDAHWFNRHGWIAVNYTYTAGHQSVADVRSAYRRMHARWPRLPRCALGQSAGGHLALMLAAHFKSLDCAISVGAPTDLSTWREGVFESVMGKHVSPALLPLRAKRVLVVQIKEDPIVPLSQAWEYEAAHPRAAKLHLNAVTSTTTTNTAWSVPHILAHGVVSRSEWHRYRATKLALLRRVQNSN